MGRSCNRYPDEIREKILYLKLEGKTNREIGKAMGLSKEQVAWFLNNYYRALNKQDPVNYPKRKAGPQAKPEPTRKVHTKRKSHGLKRMKTICIKTLLQCGQMKNGSATSAIFIRNRELCIWLLLRICLTIQLLRMKQTHDRITVWLAD